MITDNITYRRASRADLPQIITVIAEARAYLAGNGVNQWQDGFPDTATLENDITDRLAFVFTDELGIAAYVCLSSEPEQAYMRPISGELKLQGRYCTIHRTAVADRCRGKGLSRAMFALCESYCDALGYGVIRVDTHKDNAVMRHIVSREGFSECCTVIIANGTERIVYEKSVTHAVNETEAILIRHAVKYPLMKPTDAVKLMFQNEFGGGHLISDPERSFKMLSSEYESTEHRGDAEKCEYIGNGIYRLNLAALDISDTPLTRVNECFVRSAAAVKGDIGSFKSKLEILRVLTEKCLFGFGTDGLDCYIKRYAEAGFPPVSHSPEYRAAYRPAYRVMTAAELKELMGYEPARV